MCFKVRFCCSFNKLYSHLGKSYVILGFLTDQSHGNEGIFCFFRCAGGIAPRQRCFLFCGSFPLGLIVGLHTKISRRGVAKVFLIHQSFTSFRFSLYWMTWTIFFTDSKLFDEVSGGPCSSFYCSVQ